MRNLHRSEQHHDATCTVIVSWNRVCARMRTQPKTDVALEIMDPIEAPRSFAIHAPRSKPMNLFEAIGGWPGRRRGGDRNRSRVVE